MPDDVVYRLPYFMGDDEPPLKVLYPLVYTAKDGREIIDPLTIYVGRTRTNKPFAYNPRYVVNPLVLIVGTPGSGKSATMETMIYNLLRNQMFLERGQRIPPIVVVDPEGEYHVLKQLLDPSDVLHLALGRQHYINIFDRPSRTINPLSWYMRMLPVIERFLYITPAQAAQAYRVLKLAIFDLAKNRGFTADPATWLREDITLAEIYDWLQDKINTYESKGKLSRGEQILYHAALTLSSRLDQWMYPPNDAFSRKSSLNLAEMFRYRLVILDTRGLSRDLNNLFTYWITTWVTGLMFEKGPLPTFGVRLVLVIDEAWALLREEKRGEEENPLSVLARRGRKYGIMMWLATQTPEDVDKKMFSLFGALVAGNIPSDEMVNKIVESRGMPERFKDELKKTKRGELVWSVNWSDKDFPMSGVPISVYTDYPIKNLVQVNL